MTALPATGITSTQCETPIAQPHVIDRITLLTRQYVFSRAYEANNAALQNLQLPLTAATQPVTAAPSDTSQVQVETTQQVAAAQNETSQAKGETQNLQAALNHSFSRTELQVHMIAAVCLGVGMTLYALRHPQAPSTKNLLLGAGVLGLSSFFKDAKQSLLAATTRA